MNPDSGNPDYPQNPSDQSQYGASAPPPPPGGAPAQPRNGMGIASLVTGILSIVLCWIGLVNIIALILGILAVIFGVLGIKRANRGEASGKGMPIAGIITGAIGLVISVIILILLAIGISLLSSPQGQQLQQCIQKANGDTSQIQQCQEEFQKHQP